MKKWFRKFGVMLCSVMVLSLFFGTTVFADGTDTSTFDFGQTVLTIPQGGSATISLFALKDYTYYMDHHTSKKTYLECNYHSGSSKITFHVGPDEPVGTITFWFYIADTDHHDNVQVRVVKGSGSTQQVTTAKASAGLTSAAVAFADGTKGLLTATNHNLVGYVTDAAKTPLAAFSLTNAKGQNVSMQLQDTTVANAVSWLTVTTPSETGKLTVNIPAADKAALMARGIGGLYLNGAYVMWP